MTLRLVGHWARTRRIRKYKIFTGNAGKWCPRKIIKKWGGRCWLTSTASVRWRAVVNVAMNAEVTWNANGLSDSKLLKRTAVREVPSGTPAPKHHATCSMYSRPHTIDREKTSTRSGRSDPQSTPVRQVASSEMWKFVLCNCYSRWWSSFDMGSGLICHVMKH